MFNSPFRTRKLSFSFLVLFSSLLAIGQNKVQPFIGIGTGLHASYAQEERSGFRYAGYSQSILGSARNPNLMLGVEVENTLVYLQAQVQGQGTAKHLEFDAPNNNRNEVFSYSSLRTFYLNLALLTSFRPFFYYKWNLILGPDLLYMEPDPGITISGITNYSSPLMPQADTTERTFLKNKQLGLILGIQKMLFPKKRLSLLCTAYYRKGFGNLFRDENTFVYKGTYYQTNLLSRGSYFALNVSLIYRLRL